MIGVAGRLRVIELTWPAPDLYLHLLPGRYTRVTRQDINPTENAEEAQVPPVWLPWCQALLADVDYLSQYYNLSIKKCLLIY